MPLFKSEKSLSELEEEEELLKQKRRVLEEKAAIKQIEERMGKGSWRLFSNDGTRRGLSLDRIKSWIKSH